MAPDRGNTSADRRTVSPSVLSCSSIGLSFCDRYVSKGQVERANKSARERCPLEI